MKKAEPKFKQEIENKTYIGVNQNKKSVYADDNGKHFFVCGTTGSGKTVLLSNFIKSAIDKNYPLLLVDGKGDIGDGSILDIVTKLKGNKKLYVVNLTNPSTSSLYNPFRGANATICKDMLINMTDWSEEHYKTNTERYVQRLATLLDLAGINLNFKQIIQYLPTDNFMTVSAKLLKENKITKAQHSENGEIANTSGKITENASARFSTIAESEIGAIFDETGIDIYTALKENAIILFILNPLIYPEMSPLFGRLILIDSKKAISKLFGGNMRTFFIFDEINVYASPVLIDLINKSRSANVTVICATQSLADLETVAGDPFKQQIIENCNNYIVLRQNSAKSAEQWAEIIGTRQTMEVTYQLRQDNSVKNSPYNGDMTTGYGSAKRVREFLYHPDDIKAFKTGQGIFVSRDNGVNCKLNVHKPY